jgi:hypothetical protein
MTILEALTVRQEIRVRAVTFPRVSLEAADGLRL